MWIPVKSESRTIADLARVGILVAPGSTFKVDGTTRIGHTE